MEETTNKLLELISLQLTLSAMEQKAHSLSADDQQRLANLNTSIKGRQAGLALKDETEMNAEVKLLLCNQGSNSRFVSRVPSTPSWETILRDEAWTRADVRAAISAVSQKDMNVEITAYIAWSDGRRRYAIVDTTSFETQKGA